MTIQRTEAEQTFWDQHGFWPDDMRAMGYCTCVHSCMDDPRTGCSLSGTWHVHPNSYPGDVFGPCPVHPDAPGDH